MNDKTVTNNSPIKVPTHKEIISKNHTFCIVLIIYCGTVASPPSMEAIFVILSTIPCTISKQLVINSIPYTTNPHAIVNRKNN